MDLDNRVRTQDWNHDLSEDESSDENHQTADGRPRPRRVVPKRRLVAQARVPLRELEPWFAQLRRDTQAQGRDEDTIHQRMTGFWESTRDEKPIVEVPLSRDLISSDMSSKVP